VSSTILTSKGTGRADINRFVTGAQKTERHHIETAFDICLETAKLAIEEFTVSKSD